MHVSSTGRLIAMVSLVASLGACAPPSVGQHSLMSIEFVSREPPAPRAEAVPDRPSQDAVWINGHWAANNNNYQWTTGHWERPEGGKTEWVAGKWSHEDRGWYYTEGYWR